MAYNITGCNLNHVDELMIIKAVKQANGPRGSEQTIYFQKI